MNLIAALIFSFAQAAIPPSAMILQRLSENAGNGSYTIEQELQFNTGAEPLTVKETWNVDSDKSLRVTAVASKENKELLKIQVLYLNGQRWILREGRRESAPYPRDFFERLMFSRTPEEATQTLAQWKILPHPQATKKKPAKKAADVDHDPEPFMRLARTGGVIAWNFGPGSASSSDIQPGLWVEQDAFVIRKVRLPSNAEMTAENYTAYTRGLFMPKDRTIRWGNQSVAIHLLSVNGKSKPNTMNALDSEWRVQGLQGQPALTTIEEFYTRFR